MPHYDYRCQACGHELELFQSMSEGPKRKCPACGKRRLERLIGTGGGILFRGSGFYQTDYKEEGSSGSGGSSEDGGETSDAKGGESAPADSDGGR